VDVLFDESKKLCLSQTRSVRRNEAAEDFYQKSLKLLYEIELG